MSFPSSLSSTPQRKAPPITGVPVAHRTAAIPTGTNSAWRLQAALDATRAQHKSAHDAAAMEWKSAENYLEHKGAVTEALEQLSTRAQMRSKGLFEGLLTTLVREVMPDKADQIRLTSGLRNHKRTLDIDVEVNGELENVFRDKGGAVKNLISMGIRFIVLSRSMNRRFIVFDEADCWIKPDYIPRVAKLIFELSHRIGVQVIYISHHDSDYFQGKARIVNLKSDQGHLFTESGDEPHAPEIEGAVIKDENADLNEGLGLKYLRLVNFKAHESTYIPLSPNVTVINGLNDLGKSAITQAFGCVSQNAGRTSVIRHRAEACEVEIGLEAGMSLSWSYQRNGARKTQYTLSAADGSVLESHDSAKEVPSWLGDYLGMNPVGGFDLHLHTQDEPNFMIQDNIPATQRAELLSLGREAYYAQQMSLRHSEKVSHLTREANRAKSVIATHMNALTRLKGLDEITQRLNCLDQDRALLVDAEKDRGDLSKWLADFEKISGRIATLSACKNIAIPSAPALTQVDALKGVVEGLSSGRKRLSLLLPVRDLALPKTPELRDTQAIAQMGIKIVAVKDRLAKISTLPTLPEAPVLEQSGETEGFIKKVSELRASLQARKASLDTAQKALASTQQERAALIESLGGQCPSCFQIIDGEHHHE